MMAAAAIARVRWQRHGLTFREHQVLFGYLGGMLPPQIAQVLGLELQTVKVMMARVRGKYGVLWMNRVETIINLNAALKDAFYSVPKRKLDDDPSPEGAD